MIKITSLVGARPQIIKAAALSRAVRSSFSDYFVEQVVHSGQHYDSNLSEVFIKQLKLTPPFINLEVGSNTHAIQTSLIMQRFEEYLLSERPDIVVLYGDTNTTLAGALAASKIQIPIAHIEAGLRSYNKAMPEELNRIICDQCSSFLFTPNNAAIGNLEKEGYTEGSLLKASIDNPFIKNVGDIMMDNLKWIETETSFSNQQFDLSQKYGLLTIHRKENIETIENLHAIFSSLPLIANETGLLLRVLMHPGTKQRLQDSFPEDFKLLENSSKIELLKPQDYLTTMYLLKHSSLLITDSGGLQKEAHYFKIPLVVVRKETEWIEIIEQGLGMLCAADNIIKAAQTMITKENEAYLPLYGTGDTAKSILKIIRSYFDD